MSHYNKEKTIRMANQIAQFFHSKPEADGVEGVAEHINKYWEKRMRLELFDLLSKKETAFDPLLIKAAPLINRPHLNADAS